MHAYKRAHTQRNMAQLDHTSEGNASSSGSPRTKTNAGATRRLPAPSAFEAVVNPEKYRVPDDSYAPCGHGHSVAMCSTAGKVGRNGRSAAIGATLFWLTCPSLNNLVARFERHGIIALLTSRFATDKDLLERHVASHALYTKLAEERLPEDQAKFFFDQFVKNADLSKRKFGNAAVGHPEDLKCMHALVAQSLAGAFNPLGNLCLHYILRLQNLLDHAMCSVQEEDKVTDTSELHARRISHVVDKVSGVLEFLDERGLDWFLEPPMETLQDGTKSVAAAKCCQAAEAIVFAAEGHAPRARKKYRKN